MQLIGGLIFSITFVVMKWLMTDKRSDQYVFYKEMSPPTRSFGWIFWRLFFGGVAAILLLWIILINLC